MYVGNIPATWTTSSRNSPRGFRTYDLAFGGGARDRWAVGHRGPGLKAIDRHPRRVSFGVDLGAVYTTPVEG
jgi:hypothetical protein